MRGFVIGVAVAVLLGGLVGAQQLSGEWELELTVDPSQASFAAALDFTTDITVNYEVGGWTFSSMTKFDDAGWSDQSFTAGGVLGTVTFSSTADFDPSGSFDGLDVTTGIALGGVTFDLDFDWFDLDTELTVGGRGSTGLVDIDVDVTFGGDDNDVCDLNWAELQLEASYPFCCGEVSSTIEFDCDGFDYISFEAQKITIPNLPWFTISAELTFQVQTKTLVLSPSFDFGADVCFEVYATQDVTGGTAPDVLTLGTFYVTGLKLECTIADIKFTGISYWGTVGTKPAGLGDYWEMYRIESESDGCCGPFGFDIAVFFHEASTNLGDVEWISASLSYDFGEHVTVSAGTEMEAGVGVDEWSVGFEITF